MRATFYCIAIQLFDLKVVPWHVPRPWPVKRTAMHQEQPKIFLVDDDLFCLKLMEQAIRSSGYHDIHTFENGSDCLNNLTEEPDIIFLDQMMGSVSGVEVLKAIKRFNPDIYVVFVSGQQQVEVAVESLKFGAFDYIVKNETQRVKLSSVLEKIMLLRARLNQRKTVRSTRFFSLFNLVPALLLAVGTASFSC